MGLNDYYRLFRISKYLIAGNIAFLAVFLLLLLFFLITGLVDVYNNVPVFKWLDAAWKYVQGMPFSEIYSEGEKLLTEAPKKISPQDILTPAQQFLTLMVSLIKALMDKIIGITLLIFALILRVLNKYTGRPNVLFSWMLVAASPVATIIEYL